MSTPGHVMRQMTKGDALGDQKLSKGTFRRVVAYARPFWSLIGVFVAVVIVQAALGVAPPLLFREIIDQGVLAHDRAVVVTTALVVVGIAVVNAAFALLQRWCSAKIGEGLIYDLRTAVFDHVSGMPLAFFTRTQTGKLVSRLNSDVIGAQRAFTSTLSGTVSNVFGLVLTLAAMLTLSWQVTVGALVLLPLFVIPARLVGRKLADLTRRQMSDNAEMSATMTERFSVSGALLVKLFGRPTEEHDRFAARAASVRDVSVAMALNGRFFITTLTLVAALATALVYGVGGSMAVDGRLTVGTLTALAGLLGQLYGPLTALTNLRIDVMGALVSFERVFEILDLRPAIAEKKDARPLSGEASVEFEDVRFAYPRAEDVSLASLESVAVPEHVPGTPVLKGISFRVAPGSTTAIVGHSGSGKTTLTHLVARLYDVTGGTVRVGGIDVRDLRTAALQEAVGYVTQDAHMFHDTVRENLCYARPEATDEELWQVLEAAHIADLVRRLPEGLDTLVGERGYRLSGGERQRLAIARLLLKAPPIVVLDEATAHLDSDSEAAVQRALDVAMEQRTSLVVAHRLSTIRGADQILVVEDGRIVERGTHTELLDRDGAYAELYRTQFAAPDRSAGTPAG
ncbi:ABC transporter ATP-binding protein [Raineyella sp. LH-20]|uniref:ABC transporter ATP-binding protein n=1 Tax=Raineyella sp. LH-20 TaxID=3081204 RepID=UPI002952F27F|nr:ABC transporter ATP-binding protein [Raineyella sp. LH-20]WOP18477.1 ABC transporter ATP-binding protein [Raineyella sp. LH-20]